MGYRYFTIYRPPVPGAIPMTGLISITSFDERRFVDEIGRAAWGYAVYDRCLTVKECAEYELIWG